ncbi:aspartate carbamoyltransferase [Solibaculum intestinale]|uniref:Aspartate carbamoyltransferase n=1 Tax=Solibaculum intestinale TaxID=3133165 RepID=A0ABV1DXF5_9FIRM
MTNRHLIDLSSMSQAELSELLNLAGEIRRVPGRFAETCHGKIMATLFYEPSTRTQMSFQAAMLRLGGRIIGFDDPNSSSVAKGESLKDTVRVVSGYSDILVMRHPKAGAAKAASLYSRVPVVNAGDGGHLHPTQTLTDLVTLNEETGRLTDLCIGCCGDLKNGRTVHSLIKQMSRYPGNSFVLISTPQLGIPSYLKDYMDARGVQYTELPTLEEAMPLLDVLYMTRIQRERFSSAQEYEQQKGVYVLDQRKLKKGKKSLRVLHPLPRVDEITVEVDDDPRAIYFEQTEYGMYARMALILTMLEGSERRLEPCPKSTHDHRCQNPNCITGQEAYLPRLFSGGGDMLTCDFCDERMLVE